MPTTDSEVATVTLEAQGVWIHDPLDAEGTIVQFPYGSSQRSTALEPAQVARRYAGREHPVVDFGVEQDSSYAITIDVVNGESHLAKLVALESFAQLRRTLALRDNRGRMLFGTMSRYSAQDQDWGWRVSFTFTAVDYDEGEEVTA